MTHERTNERHLKKKKKQLKLALLLFAVLDIIIRIMKGLDLLLPQSRTHTSGE